MPRIVSVFCSAQSPLSDLTTMSVNKLNDVSHESNDGSQEAGVTGDDAIDVEEAVDEGDDVNPLTLKHIWDDEHLVRIFLDNGKQVWKCGYCKTTFLGHNATKALAHVTRQTGQDIGICPSFKFIPLKMQQSHRDLSVRACERKRKFLVGHESVDRSIDEHQQHLTATIHKLCHRKQAPVGPTPPDVTTTSASVVSKSSKASSA